MKLTTKPLIAFQQTRKKFKEQGLRIAPMKGDDFNSFVSLISRIYAEFCPQLLQEYKQNPWLFRSEFLGHAEQDNRRVFYSVKNSSGQLVGCGGLIQYDPNNSPNMGQMVDVFMNPKYRGLGLEQAVAEDLIRKARMIAFNQVFVETRPEFKTTLELCDVLGFKKAEEYCSNDFLLFQLKL